MKSLGIATSLLCSSFLLAACASLPPFAAAPSTPAGGYTVGGSPSFFPAPDSLHHFIDDRKEVLYFQNYGGGGVALGVLLGPIGVLANMSMIKSVTEDDAKQLHGMIPIDTVKVFQKYVPQDQYLSSSRDVNGEGLLSPYLLVEKIDDEHFRCSALLIVDLNPAGTKWTRQYMYELQDVYTKYQLTSGLSDSQLASLTADLGGGLQWAMATYLLDAKGSFSPREKETIKSDFLTPRNQIPMTGYGYDAGPNRIGFATAAAVYSLSPDGVTITK